MTREELLAKLVLRRSAKLQLTWAQFTSAVTAASSGQKAAILQSINAKDFRKVAEMLGSLATDKRKELATVEVATMAADDLLSVDDLIALLG